MSTLTQTRTDGRHERRDSVTANKILIVEDDQRLQMALAVVLRSRGYEVALAADAVGAVSAAVHERPDLILLDLGLPAGSGTVVLERLRNLSTTSFTPVIVVTGRFVDLDGKQILREFGCETVLRKPVTSDQLIAAVTDALTARLSSGDASEALDR